MGSKRVFVAGHNGMVGSSICRELQRLGNHEIIVRSREQLDLRDQAAVKKFFETEPVDQVYVAAAKVGGILANNSLPFDFLYENLLIESNVIGVAFESGIKRLVFLGSSCIYPKLTSQPISEQQLLSGFLEPTNEPYAIAKIAGIKLCESLNRQFGVSHSVDYRSIMPSNLYGPGDNYHEFNSHVIPSLIRRFHHAKITESPSAAVWGTGSALREFLFVDDLAKAAVHVMNIDQRVFSQVVDDRCQHVNVGTGFDYSIRDLAHLIAGIIGFDGEIVFDNGKPDGTPRKLLDCRRINRLGWRPTVGLEEGLKITYDSYLSCDPEGN